MDYVTLHCFSTLSHNLMLESLRCHYSWIYYIVFSDKTESYGNILSEICRSSVWFINIRNICPLWSETDCDNFSTFINSGHIKCNLVRKSVHILVRIDCQFTCKFLSKEYGEINVCSLIANVIMFIKCWKLKTHRSSLCFKMLYIRVANFWRWKRTIFLNFEILPAISNNDIEKSVVVSLNRI